MRKRRRNARKKVQHQAKQIRVIEPLVNKLPIVEVLSQEGVEMIHRASMRMLKEVGFLVIDYPQALERFRQHGAKVEGEHVWIDEDLLMHFVKQAPSTFTQLARNPKKNLTVGGRNIIFAPVYGPPFVMDRERGRRQGKMSDFDELTKLVSMIPILHHGGGVLVEPNDLPVDERHLDMLMSHILHHDKSFMGSVVFEHSAQDSVTMAEILHGKEAIRENPALLSVINASSPLRFDDRMFGAVEVYAKARQTVMITPFIIAGAMSPTSMAATVAQANAETLFGICFAQMINPGTPCIYGSFLANMNMKSGAPCFGTAENTLAFFGGSQMARHYKIPYRSGGNYTASRIPDAQAGYESANTMLATVQGNTNFILHAAGWLEGALTTGYEKMMIDVETLYMLERYVKGIPLTEEDFAWDAYEEVGPGKHFLGTQHTMRHYKDAFYDHQIFKTDSYEQWADEGSKRTDELATDMWKQLLKDYEAPPIDPAKREELEAFVTLRRAEIKAGKLQTEWKG